VPPSPSPPQFTTVGPGERCPPVVNAALLPGSRPHPCDIRVIGALGDSLTSAVNVESANLLSSIAAYEWPGMAWSIGSFVRDDSCSASGNGRCQVPFQTRSCWTGTDCSDCGNCPSDQVAAFRTIPNMLEESCSNIPLGASTGDTYSSIDWGFNFAEAGAVAADMPAQARDFVAATASYALEWKMMTVLIGGNNICAVCNDEVTHSVANYELYLRQMFEALLPVRRLIVNVPLHPDYTQLSDINWGFFGGISCGTALAIVCPCMGTWASNSALQMARSYINGYNEVLTSLASEFNGPDHAGTRGEGTTFIVHPFGRESDLADKDLIGDDCFHPSARGQALLARGLWNNLMQPTGAKSTSISESDATLCPSPNTVII